MVTTRRILVALLLLSASCAGSSTPEAGTPKPVVDRNVISNEELQDPVLRGMDALRAIQYLRPTFFRAASGPLSFSNATAGLAQYSMDYGPLQPLSHLAELSSLSLQMVYQIRYLDLNDAQNRFGILANSGPVIVVVSNKQ